MVTNLTVMPPTQIIEEHIVETVPTKRVLVAGIILGIFHPPVIGLVYALCFAFTKATRKVALWVALWTISWTLLYSFSLGFIGAWIKSHPNSTIRTVAPIGNYLFNSTSTLP